MRPHGLWCALTLTATLATGPAQAQGQWCGLDMGGGTNCGFSTQAQCRAAMSGLGGSCTPSGARSSDTPARPSRLTRPARSEPRKKEPPRRVERPAPAKPAAPVAPAAPAAATPAAAAPAGNMAVNFAAARQLVLDGQYQAGLTALQALGFDDHPDVATYIGLAHNKLGRPDQARTWYERALAANPDHLLTLSFSGMLDAERGDLRRAQDNLAKLRRLCGGTCNEYKALEAVLAAKR